MGELQFLRQIVFHLARTLLLTRSDDESALSMCRGPLKASGTLFKRFDQLKDRVRVAHNNALMGLHLRPEDVKVQKRKQSAVSNSDSDGDDEDGASHSNRSRKSE